MPTAHAHPRLGAGIGWRPEMAEDIEALPGIEWVEVVAENLHPDRLPESLLRLRRRGVTVVPHGVSLGLGGAERPAPGRLSALAQRAEALESPLVTEHIAFVRADGARPGRQHGSIGSGPYPLPMEAGHLLPVPRTFDALDVLCENIRIAQDALPVPLALENIAALVNWPDEEMTEGQFLTALVERTGVRLLIDVANLHTNHVNRGEHPATALDELPLESLAYVHVAGGIERDGVWHDSHAHPVSRPVLDVLGELCARTPPPGTLLERDEDFPPAHELAGELAAIRTVAEQTTAVHTGGQTTGPGPASASGDTEAARVRLSQTQSGLLAALVADARPPAGFDQERLDVQTRALTAKRADVVAKVAPELPRILGEKAYRTGFAAYARGRPLRGGHRHDALEFARHLLDSGLPEDTDDARARRKLRDWWLERSGPAPLPENRLLRRLRLLHLQFGIHFTAVPQYRWGE